jgi:hypothetical protein
LRRETRVRPVDARAEQTTTHLLGLKATVLRQSKKISEIIELNEINENKDLIFTKKMNNQNQ